MAQVARATFLKPHFRRGTWRPRSATRSLSSVRGRAVAGLVAVPAAAVVWPARLGLGLVLQFAEGLSDRQAAEAVRGRIDWKYALLRHEVA